MSQTDHEPMSDCAKSFFGELAANRFIMNVVMQTIILRFSAEERAALIDDMNEKRKVEISGAETQRDHIEAAEMEKIAQRHVDYFVTSVAAAFPQESFTPPLSRNH